MHRCDSARRAFAGLLVATIAGPLAGQAAAQVPQRSFPAQALRGEIAFGQPPLITLNGKPARLAPGAKIRGQNNLLAMSAALAGQSAKVHYTLDNEGLVYLVWILNEHELANQPWPTTLEQARTWRFDPVAQVWSKP